MVSKVLVFHESKGRPFDCYPTSESGDVGIYITITNLWNSLTEIVDSVVLMDPIVVAVAVSAIVLQ